MQIKTTVDSTCAQSETARWNLAGYLADGWIRDQCRDPHGMYFLIYKPSGPGKPGELNVSRGKVASDWELATPERIMPNWTRDQVCRFIAETAYRLPILPT